jgi:hypothetical protein
MRNSRTRALSVGVAAGSMAIGIVSVIAANAGIHADKRTPLSLG